MEQKKPPFRRRSPGWVELSVAVAALVVSGVSLYIAQQQTSVMQRQLAATIWPAIQFSTSNLRGEERVITLSLENVGVGPAHIHHFGVSHNGRAVTNPDEFIAECCADETTPIFTITSFVRGRILPAGQRIDFFTLPFDPAHPEVYRRFDRVRHELDVRICYCSVLEECWMVVRGGGEPEPVRSCADPPELRNGRE